MEVVLSVSEAELEEFPEEATESSGQQKHPVNHHKHKVL